MIFLSRLVTMDEIWLYHYDPETKQQSVDWRHSGSPRPKNSECKNALENFSPRFFGIKTASSSLINFEKAKLSMRSITHLLVQLKNILKKKRRVKFTKGVLFPHDNAPAHPALATQKILAYPGFQCLDHPPFLRIWPRRTTTCSLGWKNWKSLFFFRRWVHCCSRRPGWTYNLLIFFLSGLQKLEQRSKKYIELSGE